MSNLISDKIDQIDQINQIDQIDQIDQIEQIDQIPFVIKFDYDFYSGKYLDDIYDFAKSENHIIEIIINTFKRLMIEYEFVIYSESTQKTSLRSDYLNYEEITYESFVNYMTVTSYDSLFTLSYVVNNEWYVYKEQELKKIFDDAFGENLKNYDFSNFYYEHFSNVDEDDNEDIN